MTELTALATNELRIQWRRGTVVASAAVVVTYLIVLALIPDPLSADVLPYLVFSDPAALGFFFIGGSLLADRAEGVATALTVTPSRTWQLVAAPVTVLAGLGSLSAILIAAGTRHPVDWGVFVFAVVATALAYTLFGYAVAMRARTVNEYFARATLSAIPLFAPLPLVVAFAESPWLGLWPTTASLQLLRRSIHASQVGWVLPAACLLVACGLAAWWAHRESTRARRGGRA